MTYRVETENNGNGWSWIVYPDGYREGPIRYRWEAEEWAEEMNNGKPPPARAVGEVTSPKEDAAK